ncbi:MAG: DUF4115 domain-containing protein [Bacteroidota bacterium]|nr:DUF4115 domain-containing protein [Bacteroidota bacterium]
MNTFSEELRKERIAKNIALADIAASTHINIKYLEALEQGSFDMLPQTYIRAFIREYALAVGFPPDEILHRYDVLVTRKYSETEDMGWDQHSFPSHNMPVLSNKTPEEATAELIKQRDTRRTFALAALGMLILAIVYFGLMYTSKENLLRSTKETPFQQVVQEQEREIIRNVVDTASAISPAPQDSIVLAGVTTDSVWMTVSEDGNPPRELLAAPNRALTWSAKEKFTVTLGNAGGIRFSLNGKNIGVLGKRGEVLRNITLARPRELP